MWVGLSICSHLEAKDPFSSFSCAVSCFADTRWVGHEANLDDFMVLCMNFTGFPGDLEAYLLHIGLLGTTAGITYIMIKFGPSVACMWLCCRSNHIVYTCVKTNDLIYR